MGSSVAVAVAVAAHVTARGPDTGSASVCSLARGASAIGPARGRGCSGLLIWCCVGVVFSTMYVYVYVYVYVMDWCVRCPSPAHWGLV